ncbi:hypothetical protein [Fimbriiglobus ruber]|uniref:Uncharacterized protein n=1 Tax=Fimbriiglobus ruber TaxID=1908690 RepID=A0A225DVX4_9BACT|nr:hypothetical protein [Fimbriiglobus ruber]OWK45541.1 hypothetical protein FRUB_01872 [Fimbriiglobus ruber]
MTFTIDDRQVRAFAATAAQCVLDRLSAGLIDEAQDELLTGTTQAIEEVMRSELPPSVEVWNRAWDL